MADGDPESEELSFQLITILDPGYVEANDLTFSLLISVPHTVGI